MNFSKQSITAAIAFAMGTVGVADTESAVIFTFQNNATATNPDNTLFGFKVNTEFHIATASGPPPGSGSRDVIFGGEQWIFSGDTTGSLMIGVANTTTNSGGGSINAPLTTGVAGFPVASTAGTVATILQAFTPLFLNDFYTMAAPTTGNIIGQTFGAAFLDAGTTNEFTQAGSFTITMPVIHAQWVNGSYIIGGDPNPANSGDKCAAGGPCGGRGVVFSGETDGVNNFALSASYRMTSDEVSVAGFIDNYVEWSLKGTYTVIPVPAAVWLFGSGLIGLGALARRKKQQTVEIV